MRIRQHIFKAGSLLLLAAGLLAGCEKTPEGFLSDRIYYLLNPYYQQQGINSVSGSLVMDGSTNPVNVSIVSITNMATGKSADSMFLKPQTISTFKGVVTVDDNTLEMLKAKLQDSLVAPFNVNPIGGRLQFTAASQFIDSGRYSLSIKVKNIRGERTINDACTLVINPMTAADTVMYLSWSTVDATGAAAGIADQPHTEVTRDPNGPDKIVFKWLDAKGTTFNPSKGEVVRRSDRPTFKEWDPYYPEIKTDTSIEYQYPSGVPRMPAFLNLSLAGIAWADGICYYRVPTTATTSGVGINTVSTVQYNITHGTYTVTYYLFNVTKK